VFVLDTSALLTLRSDEPGADRVEVLLQQAQRNRSQLLVSFMTRMEISIASGARKEKRRPAMRSA
jgi:uncharacterized protein with PIN domain